jgi:hypothetical protein
MNKIQEPKIRFFSKNKSFGYAHKKNYYQTLCA